MKSKFPGLAGPSALVYSTDSGRICPDCQQPVAGCLCKAPVLPSGDGIVRVSRETKGRGGKSVTIVRGVLLQTADLAALGKWLKSGCGTGGTVKDGVIEVQGDHCDKVLQLLHSRGYTVKRSGG